MMLVPSQKFTAGEQQAEARFPGQRPAGVAHQDIDLAGLQRGEPGLRGHRHPFHLVRIAQRRGGDGAAIIGIEPAHDAVAVQHRKAGDLAAGAAQQLAASAHRVERRRAAALRESGPCIAASSPRKQRHRHE